MRKPVDDFHMGDFGEWNALLQALQRRDDTFYVVGVGKGEHLLLPAVSHNETRPPKMALILPARTSNGEFKIYFRIQGFFNRMRVFVMISITTTTTTTTVKIVRAWPKLFYY